MQPIQDLLNRIRWDKEFGKGRFEIGIYDRLEDRIVLLPFAKVHFLPGDHFAFQVENEYGEPVSIPFHRVREVRKDGILIWHRKQS